MDRHRGHVLGPVHLLRKEGCGAAPRPLCARPRLCGSAPPRRNSAGRAPLTIAETNWERLTGRLLARIKEAEARGPSEAADYLQALGFDERYLAQERALGLQKNVVEDRQRKNYAADLLDGAERERVIGVARAAPARARERACQVPREPRGPAGRRRALLGRRLRGGGDPAAAGAAAADGRGPAARPGGAAPSGTFLDESSPRRASRDSALASYNFGMIPC